MLPQSSKGVPRIGGGVKTETLKAESGGRVLGERAATHPHQLEGLGSASELPSGVRGATPTA